MRKKIWGGGRRGTFNTARCEDVEEVDEKRGQRSCTG